MKMILEVMEGHEKGRKFEFDRPDRFLVGRSPQAHFQLNQEDLYVSRYHFFLTVNPPFCYIKDLQSTNGTYVNGKRIVEAELHDGDIISIGKTLLKVNKFEKKEILQIYCANCHKNITDEIKSKMTENLSSSDFLCAECRMKIRLERTVPRAPRDFYCHQCQCTVTSFAHADGRAEELANVALYLCDVCAQKEQKAEMRKIGEYRILQELGRGGMGVVYEAMHEPTHRLVALKKILPEVAVNDRARKLFQREMSVLQSLTHEYIVQLFDHGNIGEEFYFISEYLPGGALSAYAPDNCRDYLCVGEICRIFFQVLEGLDFAHKKGFVHRDIKPQNILLTKDRKGKLSDFGLAKNLNDAGMTRMGEVAGTLVFMSPEQILNYKNVRPPADVYSVGVSLYYMLTGKFPYNFPTQNDVIKAVLRGKAPKSPIVLILEEDRIPIQYYRKDLPSELAEVANKSVRKKEKNRFKSAQEMRNALKEALNEIEGN